MQDPAGHSHPLDPETQRLLALISENTRENAKSIKALRDSIERLDENDVIIAQLVQQLCHKVAVVEVDVARFDSAD